MKEIKLPLSPRSVKLITRFIVSAIFFIAGFNFSNSAFFGENPLFGIQFLAEMLISVAAALFGFSTVPTLARRVVMWVEKVVEQTISKIVTDFWNQQSRKMQSSRRERQKEQKKNKEKKAKDQLLNRILLDTSVLVDGRIMDIVEAGFLDKTFIVPQFVIDELHLISDSEENQKRQRGRRGLDILESLKKRGKVIIFKTNGGTKSVDKGLLVLAKKFKMKLMTVDFNLNKVAKIEDIQVLNINELVEAVKTQVLPGDTMIMKVIHAGKERGQGVGYLDDGTMIVVDGANKMIGLQINVKVIKVIQGPAGKMLFCTAL